MLNSSFKELVRNLFDTTRQVDNTLGEFKSIATEIEVKYKPRAQFIRWRNSQEGQLWKQQQYKVQSGCCAICKESIALKGSHIDHIKPLSYYPHLAIDTRNLQIACLECNTAKNNKISNLTQ